MALIGRRPPKVDKLRRRGDVPGLMRALEYGRDGDSERAGRDAPVRAEAVAALAQFSYPGVSEALVGALRDPSETVRRRVAVALYAGGLRQALDPLCTAVMGWTDAEDAPRRGEALTALEAMADPEAAVRAATELIAREAAPDDADREVMSRLVLSAPDAESRTIERLLALLAEPPRGARAGVLLVWLAPASVEPLIDALGEEGKRERAAFALGYIHDKRAVEPLCKQMLESPDAAVRRAAAWALGEIRDLLAAGALMLAANDPDYDVRTEASRAFDAFGNVGVAMVVSALMPAGPELSGSTEPAGAGLSEPTPGITPPASEHDSTDEEPRPAPRPAPAPRSWEQGDEPTSVLALLRMLRRRHNS